MESDVRSVCFRGDFTIKTVIVRAKSPLKNVSHGEAFLFVCNALAAASLVRSHCILRIEKLSNRQMPGWMPLGWSRWGASDNSTLTLNSQNDMISIHHRSARTNEGKIRLILSDYVMNGFIMSGIMLMTATPSQLFDV